MKISFNPSDIEEVMKAHLGRMGYNVLSCELIFDGQSLTSRVDCKVEYTSLQKTIMRSNSALTLDRQAEIIAEKLEEKGVVTNNETPSEI